MSARPACWLVLASLLAACAGLPSAGSDSPSQPPTATVTAPSTTRPAAPHVTGTYPAHCTSLLTGAGALPDRQCTPGAATADNRATVCVPGYAAARRPPSRETNRIKTAAMRAYGLTGEAELDHLVPLSLGGSNDVRNLWPQVGGVPNAKDAVERSLLAAVCQRGADLETAQRAIATDWPTAAEAIR